MPHLNLQAFFPQYRVRKLCGDDLAELYRFCQTNPQYYAACGEALTMTHLMQDLTTLPPGKTLQDKYYVGIYDGAATVAVLDLIDGYPQPETAFLGFFMVNGNCAGQGLGTKLIETLCQALNAAGFTTVRLGYVKDNVQAAHFWTKNQFVPLREIPRQGPPLILAERRL